MEKKITLFMYISEILFNLLKLNIIPVCLPTQSFSLVFPSEASNVKKCKMPKLNTSETLVKF